MSRRCPGARVVLCDSYARRASYRAFVSFLFRVRDSHAPHAATIGAPSRAVSSVMCVTCGKTRHERNAQWPSIGLGEWPRLEV